MAADHVKFFVFAAVLQYHWNALDEKGKADTIADLINRFGIDTIRLALPYMHEKNTFPDVVLVLEAAINAIP